MTGHQEMTDDGEMFFVADRMLKARSIETVAARTFQLGSTVRQDVVFLTVHGDVNNSGDQTDDVTIGFTVDDIPGLIKSLAHSFNAIKGARQ